MDALSSAGPAPDPNAAGPDSIDVTPPDAAGAGPSGGSDLTPAEHLQNAIDEAQAALQAEPDSGHSAKLAKVVQELYAIQADQQDSHMSAMGAEPKKMRAMHRAGGGY
jgi:hypothetical protein